MLNNTKTYKVLITAINSSPALNVITYLRQQHTYPIEIIGCDVTEHTAGLLYVDKFYKIPKCDSPSLLSAILNICDTNNIDIIIPVFEPELLILSENRELFSSTKILLPSKEVVRLCLNKESTLSFFSDNDIPTCKIYHPSDVLNFPLFMKPKVGNSSKGIRIIRSSEELKLYYNSHSDLLCELLQGDEFTIDIYCNKPGRVKCMLGRKRIETTDGMATRATTFCDDKLFNHCNKIMSLLNYEGVCCIQCIFDKEYKFFEINPRFGGSSNLTCEAGYNIPLYVIDTLHGRKRKMPKPKNLYMSKFYSNAYWEIR